MVQAITAAIGVDKVGIRLSPYGVFNDTGPFADVDAPYLALCEDFSALGLLYLHVIDHSAMDAPSVPEELKVQLPDRFDGPFILASGFDRATAETALSEQRADLLAFGRPFLANPDLVERMRAGAVLNAPGMSTFYTPDAKGYTNYPALVS